LFSRLRTTKAARRTLLGTCVVSAGLALSLTMTVSPAAAATIAKKAPSTSAIPLGDGYMGVGYLQDSKDFKPDTRQLALGDDAVSPDATTYQKGIDVSHYQGTINWASVKSAGINFAYIKDTEGTSYQDPDFNTNYLHAYNRGVIRGAYHFARPDLSTGAAQAKYFANHGGAWSADNLTLPGMVDLEGGCYGKTQSGMQSWILSFYNEYKSLTGRDIVIYTSPSWWDSCTGGWGGMASKSPLFVADWTTASSPTIPKGFSVWTLWQYTDSGSVSGVSGAVDRDRFNGSHTRLLALANNT
jgi:GH25 family lysozyme M1 (1,4-beta-N-acetylmuramidase)